LATLLKTLNTDAPSTETAQSKFASILTSVANVSDKVELIEPIL